MKRWLPKDLLRERSGHGHARVTFVELFFDLVFVFAITQLSHGLLQDLSATGVARTAVLFLGVWWVWIYTSWAMNWLDPERAPVRLLLFALMVAGLVLSMAIPEAFGARGLAFALAYVAMQVGRTAVAMLAIGPERPALYANFRRILAWKLAAAPVWLLGGLVGPDWRLGLWSVALAIEYAAPALGFWVPRLGRSSTADWTVEGGHLAERCGLFVIIALGESILVTGATFAGMPWSGLGWLSFLVALTGSIAMWWIYFDTGAERATRHITGSGDPGRMARLGYTYLHLPIVAGIVLAAVSDEIILGHPGGETAPVAALAILGGPGLYLAGVALFKRITLGWLPLSHNVGLGALLLLVPLSASLPPLALAAAATLVLLVVAVWERVSLRGRVTP
jgi:low temperature requirement protein LtrA